MKTTIRLMISTLILTGALFTQEKKTMMDAPIYTYTMKTLEGKEKSLGDFRGKVLMVVNTASFCGYTPQYKDLEALYKRYKDRGFVVVGFPANNFGKQEPGKDDDIAAFCERNYGVTFPMFSKISVKGDDIHPLYKYLTTETPFKEEIEWNFTKFLVDRHGIVSAKFASKIKPTDKDVVSRIEELLEPK